ncbi:MAG: acyltransferase [Cyclobacteriaceae bacterium]
METNTSIKYFPGLNALRFIAASLVIFHHVEQYKYWIDMPSLWGTSIIDSMGHKSVSFFFVLSGFLITYLLLCEREKKGFIHLGRFYLRRALRIWPLYFLIVLMALMVVPLFASDMFDVKPYELPVVLSFVLFLPNLLRIVMPRVIGANQLWSVGIEEQFYLIWPVLVGLFAKRMLPFLFTFILLKLLINIGLDVSFHLLEDKEILLRISQITQLYELFPVEQMAIGGVGASLIFLKKDWFLRIIYHPITLTISSVLIPILAIYEIHLLYFSYVDAILFVVVIMNICHHRFLYQLLEFKLFKHLGDISYGIYMWHTIVIVVIMKFMDAFELTTGVNVILHFGSFIITVVVAHLSYRYFEKPFLKFKERFSFDRARFTSEVPKV